METLSLERAVTMLVEIAGRVVVKQWVERLESVPAEQRTALVTVVLLVLKERIA